MKSAELARREQNLSPPFNYSVQTPLVNNFIEKYLLNYCEKNCRTKTELGGISQPQSRDTGRNLSARWQKS